MRKNSLFNRVCKFINSRESGYSVAEILQELDGAEVKNLKTLAQTYSAMNPSAAVAILRELDEDTAVKILSTMKVDRVGPILGEMAKTADRPGEDSMPKRAARITDKLRLLKTAKKETT